MGGDESPGPTTEGTTLPSRTQGSCLPFSITTSPAKKLQKPSLNNGNSCDTGVSQTKRAPRRGSLTDWIQRAPVPATVAMISRVRWITAVTTWTTTASGRAELTEYHLGPQRFLAIATAMAKHCDGATGRNIAVSNHLLARETQSSPRLITTTRRILLDAGWLYKSAEGTPSRTGQFNRPAIVHLTTPRPSTATTPSLPKPPRPPATATQAATATQVLDTDDSHTSVPAALLPSPSSAVSGGAGANKPDQGQTEPLPVKEVPTTGNCNDTHGYRSAADPGNHAAPSTIRSLDAQFVDQISVSALPTSVSVMPTTTGQSVQQTGQIPAEMTPDFPPSEGSRVCDLLRSTRLDNGSTGLSVVGKPKARASALRNSKPAKSLQQRRRWFLGYQIADELIERTVGLQGARGPIAAALVLSHLNLEAWTTTALKTALDVWAVNHHMDWPALIHRPGAFLANRLAHLPETPQSTAQPPTHRSDPSPPPPTGPARAQAWAAIKAHLAELTHTRTNRRSQQDQQCPVCTTTSLDPRLCPACQRLTNPENPKQRPHQRRSA